MVAAVSAPGEQDILPEEGWSQAMQDEALVHHTLLRQLQRRRGLQNKQLQTPAGVRGSVPLSVVSNQVPHANEANYSPIPSTMAVASDSPIMLCCGRYTHRSVTASNTVDYSSSAWACSTIFVPDPITVAALPTPSEVRVAQEHDQALQRWITHHHTLMSIFEAGLVECEDNTKMWADVNVTPAGILVPTALQRVVFDSLHCLAHPGVNAGMTLIKRT